MRAASSRFLSVIGSLMMFACTSPPEASGGTDGGLDGAAAAGGSAGQGTGGAGRPAFDAGTSAGRAGSAAGSGGTPNLDDAGADDSDAAASCEGEVVSRRGDCLQDDAFCTPLGDGRWCTGPRKPQCPPNSTPLAKDVPCPARSQCFDFSESLRCVRRLYTQDECAAVGGVALADPGDGSLVCPDDAVALGSIEGAGWDEGGLCCPGSKRCGARAGDTCTSSEYCAYEAGQLCGAADAEASCKPRPTSCTGASAPVCGCNQQTYQSACEAHAAGVGVNTNEACK